MKPTELIQLYKKSPIRFFTDILDVKKEFVWNKMTEIAESVRDHQFTAVKAGNSLSKSYTVARIALWYLYTHYPCTVVTTAPSQTQVEEIIWREIASAHNGARVPLGGTVLKTHLDLQRENKSKKWFATGFATRPDTVTLQATRVQGFHNENVLIIMDEAAGIPPEIWDAVNKLLTTPRQKLIAIGNPTVPTGDFVNCFKDKKFNKITVSVMDSPNYIAGKEVIPGLSGREFVQQVVDRYGADSNYYKAMVLGEIPSEDVDSLIPIAWIERAEGLEVKHNFGFVKKYVVWDVADGGEDLHCIKAFENTTEIDSVELRGKSIEEAEPYVWRLVRKIGGNAIVVDCDGVGRVAYSLLEQSKDNKTFIIPFEGSSTQVNEPQVFKNRRHEAHWKMREMFEKGMLSISSIPEQREELAAVKLVPDRNGFVAVEKKEFLKKRIGRSPDRGDTIMMMCGTFNEVPILHKTNSRYKLLDRLLGLKDYEFTPQTV